MAIASFSTSAKRLWAPTKRPNMNAKGWCRCFLFCFSKSSCVIIASQNSNDASVYKHRRFLTSGCANVTAFSNEFLQSLNEFVCKEFHPTFSSSSLFAECLVRFPLAATYTSSNNHCNGAICIEKIVMAVRIHLCAHKNCWRSEPFRDISIYFNPWALLGLIRTPSCEISRPHHNTDVVKILHFSGWSFKFYSWHLLKNFSKLLIRCC